MSATPLHKLAEKWRDNLRKAIHVDPKFAHGVMNCAAELEAALAEQWQPIETIPQDGREILALIHKRDRRIIRYSRRLNGFAYVYPSGSAKCLRPIDGWMPLPQPPTSKSNE